jgi:hypothetical protein
MYHVTAMYPALIFLCQFDYSRNLQGKWAQGKWRGRFGRQWEINGISLEPLNEAHTVTSTEIKILRKKFNYHLITKYYYNKFGKFQESVEWRVTRQSKIHFQFNQSL